MAKDQIAKLSSRQYINIDFNENARRILIIGNTENMFGQYIDLKTCCDLDEDNTVEAAYQSLEYFVDRIENNTRIDIIGNNDTMQYYMRMFTYFIDKEIIKKNQYRSCVHFKEIKSDKEYLTFMDTVKNNGIEYDFIIQNPPYSGSFHLDFLVKGIELLKKNSGKMTIIEPATWLINLRKNGKASKYDEIKAMLKCHVSKVVIENMNKEFGTGLYVPFAVTSIDFSKEYNDIAFNCFGEKKIVNSLYDCNMIGNYNLVWSIFNKVQSYKNMMYNHITNNELTENYWYVPYIELCGVTPIAVNAVRPTSSDTNERYITLANGEFYKVFANVSYHTSYDITNTIAKSMCRGGSTSTTKKFSNKNANCVYGTHEELKNWKHFIFNNKLPLFINIVMTIDQHNNSKELLPWLVDKQYTDEGINELFHFTPEEIALMDKTIKKFERNSPWFKRYMCGKDSVSDEEVQKFIDSL